MAGCHGKHPPTGIDAGYAHPWIDLEQLEQVTPGSFSQEQGGFGLGGMAQEGRATALQESACNNRLQASIKRSERIETHPEVAAVHGRSPVRFHQNQASKPPAQ